MDKPERTGAILKPLRHRNIRIGRALQSSVAFAAPMSSVGSVMQLGCASAPADDNSFAVCFGAIAKVVVGLAVAAAIDAGPLAWQIIAAQAIMGLEICSSRAGSKQRERQMR
jgi:hypothetical protein